MVNQSKDSDPDAKRETGDVSTAGLVVYRNTKDGPKFLIMYHRGWYWNFPKGKIQKKETPLEAAFREVYEETGLGKWDMKIKKGFRAHENFTFKVGKKSFKKSVALFLAQTSKKSVDITKNQSNELSGYGWFLYRDAKKLFKNYKGNEAVLKKAYDFIQKSRRPKYQQSREPSQKP